LILDIETFQEGGAFGNNNALKAGKYVVVVTPVWNEHAREHPDHMNVFLEVMCPVDLTIH